MIKMEKEHFSQKNLFLNKEVFLDQLPKIRELQKLKKKERVEKTKEFFEKEIGKKVREVDIKFLLSRLKNDPLSILQTYEFLKKNRSERKKTF
ncbi:MAG: hypothetical protein QXV83_01470 [Candidatus Anstonellaceae archaeon]